MEIINDDQKVTKKNVSTGVIHFRMSKSVKKDLERAAKEERRSFASQCSIILEQWVENKKNIEKALLHEKMGVLNVQRQGNVQ